MGRSGGIKKSQKRKIASRRAAKNDLAPSSEELEDLIQAIEDLPGTDSVIQFKDYFLRTRTIENITPEERLFLSYVMLMLSDSDSNRIADLLGDQDFSGLRDFKDLSHTGLFRDLWQKTIKMSRDKSDSSNQLLKGLSQYFSDPDPVKKVAGLIGGGTDIDNEVLKLVGLFLMTSATASSPEARQNEGYLNKNIDSIMKKSAIKGTQVAGRPVIASSRFSNLLERDSGWDGVFLSLKLDPELGDFKSIIISPNPITETSNPERVIIHEMIHANQGTTDFLGNSLNEGITESLALLRLKKSTNQPVPGHVYPTYVAAVFLALDKAGVERKSFPAVIEGINAGTNLEDISDMVGVNSLEDVFREAILDIEETDIYESEIIEDVFSESPVFAV